MSEQSLEQAKHLLTTLMVLDMFRDALRLSKEPNTHLANALKDEFDIVLNPEQYEDVQNSLAKHLQQAEEYVEEMILGVEEARTFVFNFVAGGPAVRITASYNADTFNFHTALEHRDSGETWQPLHLATASQNHALNHFAKRMYDNYV